MADFEPVELDFIIGGNTQTEGKKIVKSMDDITSASKKAQADAVKSAAAQAGVIKQIEADIKKLEDKLSKAAPGNAKMAITQELSAAKRALDEEKAALEGVNASIEKTAQKHVRLRTQVMEAKEALARLEMQGKRNTPEYAAMADELGRLSDQMGDTSMQTKILADDEKGFRAVASGVAGVAGAMSAATGVAALFGAENEELARIQTRLQAVMAITIGVQQVAETLNKDSYFSVVLLTKAKNMWAVANLKVATTLGISTIAAKALMATVTLGLSVAIGALIFAVDKLVSKNKEQKKAAEEAAKVQKEAAQSAADDYGKEISKIQSLRAALNSENVDRKRKLQIIDELKNIIPGYNAELSKEGDVIRENTTAVNNYMKAVEKSIKLKIEEKNLQKVFAEKYKIEQLEFQRPALATDEALRAEDEFNAWKKGELEKFDKEEAVIRERINKGGLVEIATTKDTKEKVAKEVYDSESAINALIMDIRGKRIQMEIGQQTDSLKKRIDGIRADRDAEIRAIEDKEAGIVDAYNKNRKGEKGFVAKTSLSQIDPELAKQLADEKLNITRAYGKKEVTETEKYQQEISDLIFQYADERTQIAYNYNKLIDEARDKGLNQWADDLEKEKQQRIDDVTLGLIEETELYKLASDDKLELSRETTQLLIEDLQKRINAEIAAGKLSKEQGEKWLKDLGTAQKSTSENRDREKNSNNPFAQLGDAISANKSAKDAVTNFNPAGMSPVAAAAALDELKAKAATAGKEMAGAAGASLQGVNAILGSVVGGLDQLGMLTDEQKKDAENVMDMVGGAANIAMGIATGNPIAIIQGSVDLLVNAIEYFDFKNKALEKSQKAHMKNVEDLELKYKKLQRAIETALGTDVYKAQREQIVNNKKQIEEYEAWLALEAQKKKKKQDAAKIAETQQKIQDLKNSIEDETKAIAEAIAQTDAKSLANELADAITGAFANGEDAALAFGDVAEQVMQNAVKNALKLQFLEKPMQNAVDQLAKDMESGGSLSDSEQAAFRDKIENAGKLYYEQLAQYSDLFAGDLSNNQTGIKGDVAKMTEETGSALVGQIIAMRLNVAALLANSKNSLDTVGKVLASLEAIRVNTLPISEIRDTLNYLKLNGIKVN